MERIIQTDCFKINIAFWKYLAAWPGENPHPFYDLYSKVFLFFLVIFYDILLTANFIFLPPQLDLFIEELLFYCTIMAIMVKCLSFVYLRDNVIRIFQILDGDSFQPVTDHGVRVVKKAKSLTKKLWYIFALFSLTAHIVHVVPPVVMKQLKSNKMTILPMPVCRFDFLSDSFKEAFQYPLYFYQAIGINVNMWYNVNMDNFFWGVMLLLIAQLDILDDKLRNITKVDKTAVADAMESEEEIIVKRLSKVIVHFDEVTKFCKLVQDTFGMAMFMQFTMASCTICVCLFRFNLPTSFEFYIFLFSYTSVMVTQILLPCSIGTEILEKSTKLSQAIYDCDWTPRSRLFKSNFRFFVARTNKPLVIVGGKMFSLSLGAFTSIINSAYSFYTLLRHMRNK